MEVKKRLWECDSCGKVEQWNENWTAWYKKPNVSSSFRKFCDPDLAATTCSEKCQRALGLHIKRDGLLPSSWSVDSAKKSSNKTLSKKGRGSTLQQVNGKNALTNMKEIK